MIKRIKSFLKYNKNTKAVYDKLLRLKNQIALCLLTVVYKFFCIFPLQDKVIGTSFYGKKYENNPRFVMEALEKNFPQIKKVWYMKRGFRAEIPNYISVVHSNVRLAYEYATSKVWIDSHHYPLYVTKRAKQLSIIMFHGGIGIKKICNEVPARKKKSDMPAHTAQNTTFYVSNSDFMNNVINTALLCESNILKCGYPKDDPLFLPADNFRKNVRNYLNIGDDIKIAFYAPTYRHDHSITDVYDLNVNRMTEVLKEKFGGEWVFMVRWHPNHIGMIGRTKKICGENVIDVTDYSNMQELLMASDVFFSDYSSCIFEASEAGIPCFIYAKDIDQFEAEQGVYFNVRSLPFPCGENNDEMIQKIRTFDVEDYRKKLKVFFAEQGLMEDGTASEVLANIINEYVSGNTNILNSLNYEIFQEQK